jgi:bacterioferritin (cytochrome b1)
MAARKRSKNPKLVALLNQALGWELRAQAMYAHYAAYVKGLESLALVGHFEGEASESVAHAKTVRDVIAMLGGEAITVRDRAPIVHTEDTRVMLKEALKTETAAAATYQRVIPQVKDNPVFFHALSHVWMDEEKAVVEMENLLGR